MSESTIPLNHAAAGGWAHLGSNQAHAQTAGSDSGLVSTGFAGTNGQANTGNRPRSTTPVDRPDGHRRDTWTRPELLLPKQQRPKCWVQRSAPDSRGEQRFLGCRSCSQLSGSVGICEQRVRKTYELRRRR